MKAVLEILCSMCDKNLGWVNADTADLPEELQEKVNSHILPHRADCEYYGEGKKGRE